MTRELPGWQVISWVVVFALPVTIPASVVLWLLTRKHYETSANAWTSLILIGVLSMYLGFFAWYRGLALAGIAHGGQVQQLQALLTLLWSALLLGEHISLATVARRPRGCRFGRLGAARPLPDRRDTAGVTRGAP